MEFDPGSYDGDDTKPEFEEDETGMRKSPWFIYLYTGRKFLKKRHEDIARWRYVSEGAHLTVRLLMFPF
jgi:hypothetical protein